MNNIMIDLETLDTAANAAILSIGAVKFDVVNGELGEIFYKKVSLRSSIASGGTISADTLSWWMRQDEIARSVFDPLGAESLSEALAAFAHWCGDDCVVWGNGAAFDLTILSCSYHRLNKPIPWKFWNERCYRTLRAECPVPASPFEGVEHNALADAMHQAKHLLKIYKEYDLLKICGVSGL